MADWTNVAQAAQLLAEGKAVLYQPIVGGAGVWLDHVGGELSVHCRYMQKPQKPRTIDIGGVKVNAPVGRGKDLPTISICLECGTPELIYFANISDMVAARDAIMRLLTGAQ